MAGKEHLKRKYFCGEIGEKLVGENITVYGWVNNKRELGGVTFIDLRDRQGILQVVTNENFLDQALVKKIGREYVISVTGKIVKRSNPNPALSTGSVELIAEEIDILTESEVPSFYPENINEVSEELRFKNRYIDLRNQKMQNNFKIRSQANLKVRNYLSNLGFLDIETPMLTKATPEGARDYLVPSRIYKGKMFALPQSPQIFKQLLMISGFERYFQIVKCFRDEDLRADRQPEFTQVDIEMSFAETDELFEIIEGLMREIYTIIGIETGTNFRRISYEEAINNYGTDSPDLRIPIEIEDFTESAKKLGSSLLNSVIENEGKIRGITLPESSLHSRKFLDNINNHVKELGGKGVFWMKKSDEGFKSSLKIDKKILETFYRENKIDQSFSVFLIADSADNSTFLAGKFREYIGKKDIDKNKLEFLWVVDFPLFFYNKEEKRLDSNHHPFTSPKLDELEKLDSDPLSVKSIAYALVLNGVEIGGGSRRINDINLQRKIFELLSLSDKEIEEKFGFFLNALKFGAPPHLGIALGFDRIIMLLTREESIREVIPFPKTTSSLCLLTDSPSSVSKTQLSDLGIEFKS